MDSVAHWRYRAQPMAGWRAVVVVVLGLLASGCPSNRGNEGPYEPYLVVWAGDADRAQSDFLAVINASPSSFSYGKVRRSDPGAALLL